MGIALILGAIPGFFIAAWFVMLMWGAFLATQFGLPTMSYPTALVVTIVMWMGIAPLMAASLRNVLSSKS
jgi:hypothetical protein